MTTDTAQPAIMLPPPSLGRSLTFRLFPGADPSAALRRLRDEFLLDWGIVGLGEPVVRALGRSLPGLRTFPGMSGSSGTTPSTQQSVWVMLRGSDRGVLFDRTEQVQSLIETVFLLDDAQDTFLYAGGRDLTGYEDGTENPVADAAAAAALVASGDGLRGSSFVAVQRWVHDLHRFRAFPLEQRDGIIGRLVSTNEEIEDAPASAHVKRTAQESYDPPAFMLRRSMPWASAHEQGLEFVAYVESLDRFERVLRRMMGTEDGVADALFTFSRPVTGGYYWCPPVAGGRLDLRGLGI